MRRGDRVESDLRSQETCGKEHLPARQTLSYVRNGLQADGVRGKGRRFKLPNPRSSRDCSALRDGG